MSKVIKSDYYSEATKGFTHRTAMEEAARCLLCHDAPCSQGCPAGTDPGKFIRSIRFRNPKGAAETIRENNVLGGTCARVCPYDRLCEEACSRTGIDRPIEIGKLQRYAIEQEQLFGLKTLEAGASNGMNVACVGAGPASLACAAELAKMGYDVTIFEEESKAGGVLSYGITPARLPQEVVDHDISTVKGLGVKFEFGKKVGADISFDSLKKDFAAVFVGIGLWQAKMPEIPGLDLPGVYSAVDFLKEARLSGGKLGLEGKKVVVVGGGDVAIDSAVTAKLAGAEHVAIYYRRTLEEAPANMNEIQYATSLGISIATNFAPAEVVGAGRVESVAFNGRNGGGARVVCDVVVFAIGQAPKELPVFGLDTNPKGAVAVHDNAKTNIEGVFAAGDVVNGGKTVVEAVAAGKAAAFEINAFLAKKGGAK